MTAGLKAKLTLEVGACVILRWSLDTVVNGALSTVEKVSRLVEFDRLSIVYDLEEIKRSL